jgi:transcriptional regulator with XRE-family HTH domain
MFSIIVLNILVMSNIALNLKILRDYKKLSQEQLANELNITRSRLGSYEEGRAEPPYDLLSSISDYFHLSIDVLIKGNLAKTSPDSLIKVGKNRLLFPVQIDSNNEDIIEVIQAKALAGYARGYSDPDFIGKLPSMTLPFKVVGKHRAFAIKGDSMPPFNDGTIIIGKYIDDIKEIKDRETYIVLTKEDGIVYKRLKRKKEKLNDVFEFHSDNKYYQPFLYHSKNILEVWSFVCSLNIGEYKQDELNMENVIRFLQSQRVEMVR